MKVDHCLPFHCDVSPAWPGASWCCQKSPRLKLKGIHLKVYLYCSQHRNTLCIIIYTIIRVSSCIHINSWLHIQVYVHVLICIHTCICTYIHIYIHSILIELSYAPEGRARWFPTLTCRHHWAFVVCWRWSMICAWSWHTAWPSVWCSCVSCSGNGEIRMTWSC